MKYPLTFYVEKLPPGVGGCANGPIIRILEKYRNDRGIYEHELIHVKQWFLTLTLHSFFYLLSKRYRLWSEVMAYRKQAKFYGDNRLPKFAFFISTKYKLDISERSALEMLTERVTK